MAYRLKDTEFNSILKIISKQYEVYAPKLFEGHGTFSDTDIIRYGKIDNADQIVFDKKSTYSFKETLLAMSETLFYFTEDEMKATTPAFKKAVIFLRNCDLHALKRLDDVYLANGERDFYYERLRSNAKFIVMGCKNGFDSCFCESMGTNVIEDYDAYIEENGNDYILDSKFEELTNILTEQDVEEIEFSPQNITNNLTVELPDSIPDSILKSQIWDEYDTRCITCGRCNFVCPTCTCFTMQDIFYEDNKNVGERRRVWASCHVDGYTDMAGGHSYRKTKGERMRFKVLHKISDHKKRFGHNMCVGCGRCDDICPEYISFSSCIGKVQKACEEVQNG